MIPSVGRIVHYKFSEHDLGHVSDRASNLNTPRQGDVYPMVILRAWAGPDGATETTCVNGRVLLDGLHDLWKTSCAQGDGEGQWSEPPRVEAPAPEPEPEPEPAPEPEPEPEPEPAAAEPEAPAEEPAAEEAPAEEAPAEAPADSE